MLPCRQQVSIGFAGEVSLLHSRCAPHQLSKCQSPCPCSCPNPNVDPWTQEEGSASSYSYTSGHLPASVQQLLFAGEVSLLHSRRAPHQLPKCQSPCPAADDPPNFDPRTNEERRWKLTPAKLLGPQWRAYSPDMNNGVHKDKDHAYVSSRQGNWPSALPARCPYFFICMM